MKKIDDIWVLIVGIVLFLVSYKFDQAVNLLFKNLRFVFFDLIFSIITNFGIVLIALVVIPSIIFYKKNKKNMYLIWATFVVSFVFTFIAKLIFLRQRPIEVFTYPFSKIINYSFPSMHTMVVFSLLPILTKFLPKQKHMWTWFAFLVAFSRIYLGFHFLSDVVFGAFAGYFIGDFMLGLYEKGKLWK